MENTKVIDTIAMIANEYANTKLSIYEVEPNDFGIEKFDNETISEITKTLLICFEEMSFTNIGVATTLIDENLLIQIS